MDTQTQMPIWAAVHLTHAAVQALADAAGVDILHIKGPTDASLRESFHDSTDADILVRPAHLDTMVAALGVAGWSLYASFAEGSPFGHAANYEHPLWTLIDVHRRIPGLNLDPEAVFDRLWSERQQISIAHRPCTTPAAAGQILIQVMHVARSHGSDSAETWDHAPDDLRLSVRALARELHGEVAFAAGIGDLDKYRGHPEYSLWKHWSQTSDNRWVEWLARVRAAPDTATRLRIVMTATRVNRTRLRMSLGHEPSQREIRAEQLTRIRHAALSALSVIVDALRRKPS